MPDDPITRLNAALEGRYRIERQLGEGGMATVYLARDLKHNRNVALKVLKPELAAVVGADRFLAEIETTANLQHPHILPLFDSGEVDSFLFYVMPYVEGESLRERLDDEHQLPVDEAVKIATKVAGALQAAHERGVIHRDIKPANILLAKGEPLVSDFGIALAVSAGGAGRLTETGLSLGTPHYMSPEQATGDLSVGAATDIYALGCVLYEMLVGEPPFTGSTPQAILGKIVTGDADAVAQHRRSVPVNVDAAVRRAIEKVPADRFKTANDLAIALSDESFRHQGAGPGGRLATVGDRRSLGVGIGIGVAVTGATLLLVRPAAEPAASNPVRFTLSAVAAEDVRLSSYTSLAISPDGSQIVFPGVSGGEAKLFRRRLDDLEVFPIPGTEGAFSQIAFSPDGGSIAAWTPAGSVQRIRLDGGGPVVLAEAATEPIGMSWSPERGLVMGMLAGFPYRGLSLVPDDGGDTQPLTDPQGEWPMDHDPMVLEGADEVLFVHQFDDERYELARLSLADDAIEMLPLLGSMPRRSSALVGVSHGVLLYIDVGDNLMAVRWDEAASRPLGSPVPVPDVPAGMRYAQLASNGTLVIRVSNLRYDAEIVDERGNTINSIQEGVTELYPRFSPDGARVALAGLDQLSTYESDIGVRLLGQPGRATMLAWTPTGTRLLHGLALGAGGRGIVRSVATDGSDVEQVVIDMGDERRWGALDVSPDGATLALAEYLGVVGGGQLDIVTMSSDGTGQPRPFASDPATEAAPRYSPSGEWIAYSSNRTGRYEVWVKSVSSGVAVQITDGGGGQPVWGADDTQLFYRTEDALMAAEFATDLAAGRPRLASVRPLFSGEFFGGPESPTATYDVHPNGSRFVLARQTEGSGAEIVVWMDWMDELDALLEDASQ